MAITLTERAASEVKKVLDEQKQPETVMLRVRVVGGGCSGFSYDGRLLRGLGKARLHVR